MHFGDASSTLDLETESVSPSQLAAVEARANAIVAEARPVTVSFEDASAAGGLRKASDRAGTLRIVAIDGIDRSACGGTHVRSTGEIGAVLLRSVEKVRKTTRVEFVCGGRALARARRDYQSLTEIATSLSASIDDAAGLVRAQSDRLKEGENARRRVEKELASFRLRARYDAAAPNASGVRAVVVRDAASMDELRDLAQASFALPRVVVVGALATPPSVLLAASEDSGLDAGKWLKEQLAAAGGRGGGSPRLAQGSVPNSAAADDVVNRLVAHVG